MNIFFSFFLGYSLLFKLASCVWRLIKTIFTFSPRFCRLSVNFSYKKSCQNGKSWLKVNWLFQSRIIWKKKPMMGCGIPKTGTSATSVRSERKIDTRVFHKFHPNMKIWEKNHIFCYNADKVYQNDKMEWFLWFLRKMDDFL